MTFFKLKVDGTLEISSINGVGFESFDTLPRHDTLAPDECKYYNKETVTVIGTEDVVIGQDADGVDIIEMRDVTESTFSVEIDYDAIQADLDAKDLEDATTAKNKALDELVITHNTVAYDAHGRAIGNMSAVMGVANFKYNQAVSSGMSPAESYQLIYKDTKIFWKGADDKPHEVMIESVCETLEKSMLQVAVIIGV